MQAHTNTSRPLYTGKNEVRLFAK